MAEPEQSQQQENLEHRQLYQDRWQRGRYYAVKRAPYYAPYIWKLRPVFTPGTGKMRVGRGWECYVDPDLLEDDATTWKLQLLWAHHLYNRHLLRQGDRDPQAWSLSCRLSATDTWDTVMKREDTMADYPGEGWPPGVLTPADLGLDPGLTPEQYYAQIYDPNASSGGGGGDAEVNAQASEIATPTKGRGSPTPSDDEGQDSPSSSDGSGPAEGEQESGGGEGEDSPKSDDQKSGGAGGGDDEEQPDQQQTESPSQGDSSGGGQDEQESDGGGGDNDEDVDEDGVDGPQQDNSGGAGQDEQEQDNPGAGKPGSGQGGQSDGQKPTPSKAPMGGGKDNSPIDFDGSQQPEEADLDALEESVTERAKEHEGQYPGTLPGDLQRAIEPSPPVKVPVERMLQRLIGRTKGRSDWATTGRPSSRSMNRDDGAVLPQLAKGLPEAVFLIDTSGSMDAEMLAAALRVGERVCKATSTQLATGDTILHQMDRKEVTTGGLRRMRALEGGGGTDMTECVRQVARQAQGKAIVVFTDGLFHWPESKTDLLGADVVWVVLETGYPWPIPPQWERDMIHVTRDDLRINNRVQP